MASDSPGFWALLALRAVVFAAVMALAFRVLSPLEQRRCGVVALAKIGMTGAGWVALGCFLTAIAGSRAAARMSLFRNGLGVEK